MDYPELKEKIINLLDEEQDDSSNLMEIECIIQDFINEKIECTIQDFVNEKEWEKGELYV